MKSSWAYYKGSVPLRTILRINRKLEALSEKEVAAYRQAKETGGTAWPEYEHFVTGFEKAVLEASQQ